MPNVLTHKYLKANEIQDNSALKGSASVPVLAYWDFNFVHNTFIINFALGSVEVLVGDRFTSSTGAAGDVAAVTVASGTWGGGNAAGTIELKNVTGYMVAPQTGTSSSGGVIGIIVSMKATLKDTGANNHEITNVGITAFDGEVITIGSGALVPSNALTLAENGIPTQKDIMMIIVSESSAIGWQATYGSTIGGTLPNFAIKQTDQVSVFHSGGLTTLDLPTGSIPRDGEIHDIALIIKDRQSGTPIISCEVDGNQVGAGAFPFNVDIDMTTSNAITPVNVKLRGQLVAQFRDGLPSNYKTIIKEARNIWGNNGIGIPPGLTGVR